MEITAAIFSLPQLASNWATPTPILTLRTWVTPPWSPTWSSAASSYWDMSSMEENTSRRAYWRWQPDSACSNVIMVYVKWLSRLSGTSSEPSCSLRAECAPSWPGTVRRGSRRQEPATWLRPSTAGELRSELLRIIWQLSSRNLDAGLAMGAMCIILGLIYAVDFIVSFVQRRRILRDEKAWLVKQIISWYPPLITQTSILCLIFLYSYHTLQLKTNISYSEVEDCICIIPT